MGIEKTLKRAEVFLGLDDSDLEKIAALPSCREEAYEAEAVVFRASDKAEYLYVLELTGISGDMTPTDDTTWGAVKSMFRE